MKKFLTLFIITAIIGSLTISSCKKDEPDLMDPPDPPPINDTTTNNQDTTVIDTIPPLPAGAVYLEPNPQVGGDPETGYDYLVNGNYIGSGIPYDIFSIVFPADEANLLNRTGDNATLSPEYTAINHSNGTKVVAPNCLQCHAGSINGEFIVGLGNINADFTTSQNNTVNSVNTIVNNLYGEDSPEWEAYLPFKTSAEVTAPYLVTDVVGANPADHLFSVLGAYRDKETLLWQEEPSYEITSETYITDVPPWWALKKKNAPLYMGNGRGSYAKMFMAASTLTLETTEEAEEILSHFDDVLAFINSIEAPAYPHEIDQALAEDGKVIFNQNCSVCHGTYGEEETYPNFLIDVSVVGTDPYSINGGFALSHFIDWYNTSWFNQGDNPSSLALGSGYVAQPLDGIWATAPYLHNGSIPTLHQLLNSETRSEFWRRGPSTPYDEVNVGWQATVETSKIDKFTYDTNQPGYGNQGHTFGDFLSEEDRMKLIEYLKTL